MLQFFKQKWQIWHQPLPFSTNGQRWFLRGLLLSLGHLITIEANDEKGVADLNSVEPQIFAFNHNCSFEAVLVPSYLVFQRQGRKISFICDWMYQHIPVLGWIFNQMDPIYVYNKPARLKYLNRLKPIESKKTVYYESIERLKLGQSIGIFPEGTRNRNPNKLLKGQNGIGYIVLNSLAPVVPIGIDFPLRLRQGKIPKLGRTILRPGAPLQFAEERSLFRIINTTPSLGAKERQKLSDLLASRITFQVMKELANLSGKDYSFPEPSFLPFERFRYQKEEEISCLALKL